MTSRVVHLSFVRYRATKVASRMCCGHTMAAGSLARTTRQAAICCWNSDTGEQIGQPWTGHNSWIRSLSLSPDGLILASASWDKTVRFWNAITGHPIGQHLQHDKEVNVVRFSPSGEFVASAGWDEKIYLWRVPWLNSVENRVRTLIRCLGIHTYRSLYLTDKPY